MKDSKSITILVSSLLILAAFSPMLSLADAQFAPIIRKGSSTSSNWSGYAVTSSKGSVTDVKGSWIVPPVTGTATAYSSFWVGIDGYSSNTVEQIGTDSDIQNGAPVYYAWFEFYPKPSYMINRFPVSPGDVISAEVKYTGGKFVATIMDTTAGNSFSVSAKVNAARTSAEWIAEAPWSGGVLPLAKFGTINFGFDTTGLPQTCYAAINGNAGSIGSFGASVQSINMETSAGTLKAQTSSLSSDGTSFSITWVSSGP